MHLDDLVRRDRAGGDASGDDASEIGIGLQNGAEHAEWSVPRSCGGATCAMMQIEQGRHAAVFRPIGRARHPALLGRAIEDGKVELLFGRVEGRKQDRTLRSPRRSGRASERSTLLMMTIGLSPTLSALDTTNLVCGSGPSAASTSTQRAIDHVEDALHLAAEISVARGIDDVDARALPEDGGHLGQDGDAALALEIVGIERALGDALVLAEGAGLLQQAVDQRGLAMVDVSDDGDIAQLHK